MDDVKEKNGKKTLSVRHSMFLEFYLQTWNATKAARMAKYKHPDVQGPRLMKNPLIAEAVQERIKSAVMDADEVLARLSDQARLNAVDFFVFSKDDSGQVDLDGIDWEVFKARGHMVKRLTWIRGKPVVEFYDAQAALIQVGRALKVFSDGLDVNLNQDASINFYIPENGRSGESDGG